MLSGFRKQKLGLLMRLVAIIASALVFTACQKEASAPPAAVPALDRPILQLSSDPKRILVPRIAMIERGGIPGVFVLSDQGRARFRMVKTGKHVGSEVEILSGLSGGETLVLGDLGAVHDGSPISVK